MLLGKDSSPWQIDLKGTIEYISILFCLPVVIKNKDWIFARNIKFKTDSLYFTFYIAQEWLALSKR